MEYHRITNRAYLFSIPLALIMLIALACTTTPAEPTPNIDATVEARAKELVAEQVNNLPPNPDLALDYFNRGVGYRQAGDSQWAIGDLTKAIKLGLPTNYKGSNLLAGAFWARGNSYADLGQYQIAINDYTKAIQLDPDYAIAYNNRGISLRNLGQYSLAEKDSNKACELDRRSQDLQKQTLRDLQGFGLDSSQALIVKQLKYC